MAIRKGFLNYARNENMIGAPLFIIPPLEIFSTLLFEKILYAGFISKGGGGPDVEGGPC